jgi:hypothetical protein
MAQHCFNYHFKTNERYMGEMERSRPIRENDEQLVQDCFKETFHLPIHDWLLIQPDKKREKLYEMLRGNPARNPAKTLPNHRLSTSNWVSQRCPELVMQSPSTRIDFNKSIYGPVPFRPDPRALAPTLISTQGIFGFTDPMKPRPSTGCSTLPDHLIKHFFKPAAAARLTPLSDEYFPLINELVKWTEKKTMGFPVDPLRGLDSITPAAEAALVKARREEDHFYPPGHQKVRKSKLARDLTTRTLHAQAKRLTA